jgi:tetratricopeptide (TPR) repeat protein
LADEPVAAFAEPFAMRARRWARKHRTLVSNTAAVLLVATIGSIVASGMLANLNGQLDGKNQALKTTNQKLDAAYANLKATNNDLRDTNNRLVLARKDADNKWQQAVTEKQTALAVRAFMQDILRQSNPWEQANQARASYEKSRYNITVRELLDGAALEFSPDKIEQKFPDQPYVQAEVLETIGESYQSIGEHAKAITFVKAAYMLREKALGPNHPATLAAMTNLVFVYYTASRYAETAKLTITTLGRLEGILASHPEPDDFGKANELDAAAGATDAVIQTVRRRLDLKHFGSPRFVLGPESAIAWLEVRAALPRFERIASFAESRFGKSDSRTCFVRMILGFAHTFVGETVKAAKIYEDVLTDAERILHPDDVFLVGLRQVLSFAYDDQGVKRQEALGMQEKISETLDRILGPEHPASVSSKGILASKYAYVGRADLAVPLMKLVLNVRTEKLGPEHADTLTSMNDLAVCYLFVGELDLAIPLFEKTLELGKAKRGPDHSHTLSAARNLAAAYLAAKRPEKALPLIGDYVDTQRKKLGAKDASFASVLAQLGRDLLRAHEFQEAEKLMLECLEIFDKSQPHLWGTFASRSILGGARLGQKKYAEAELLLVPAYEGLKQREATIPANAKFYLTEAEGRLAELFEATRTKDETQLQGTLTDAKTETVHEIKLTAGKPLVVELQSKQFNTLLKLQDAEGKTLAENDDIDTAKKNTNSRILFIPKEDGVYRVIATSFQQKGRGEYDLIFRQYSPAKAK